MSPQASGSPIAPGNDEDQVRALYHSMIERWNQRNAQKMAAAFASDGQIIGFDGTQHLGQAEIEQTVGQIFKDHVTPPFVRVIKRLRFLTPEVAHLHAIAGMIPPQKSELEPKLNCLQTMIALKKDGHWKVALFQSTPAQFHGRPEALEAMTLELKAALSLDDVKSV